ncbi:MAG TPA: carboxypeptidase-like regulatory domain-containing protein [Bryobacteraceae bacterium]|nr:carboxypeptidase-like regulatory domain-containing protein [Bryobacteraceae bacterium]
MPLLLWPQQQNLTPGVAEAGVSDGGSKDLGRIEGHTLNLLSGEPLRRVALTLHPSAGQGAAVAAVSDTGGHFSFEGLTPGTYRLSAERTGFLDQEFGARSALSPGTPLQLTAGQHIQDLEFKLTPHAVIAGKVLDDKGDPVANVDVTAFRQIGYPSVRRMVRAEASATNDLGEFRIAGLGPGSYLVAVDRPAVAAGVEAPRPKPGQQEEQYVPSFYPGVTDPADAVPVLVAAGQEVPGRDIQIRKAGVYWVRGRLAGGGQATGNVQLALLPREAAAAELGFGRLTATVKPDGAFEIRGVQAGSYYLTAVRVDGGQQLLGRLPIQVASNLDDLRFSAGQSAEITGSVRLDGEHQAALTGVLVALLPAEGVPLVPLLGRVREDGAFRIERVAADSYRLNFYGLPEGTYVKSARAAGQELLGTGLDLTQASMTSAVEITVSTKAGVLVGLVRDDDKPAAGSVVTLVPEPLRPNQPALYKKVSADPNGLFRIAGITPGNYKLYAWEAGTDLEPYLDPEFVKPFARAGVKVTVEESGRAKVDLKLLRPEDAQQ